MNYLRKCIPKLLILLLYSKFNTGLKHLPNLISRVFPRFQRYKDKVTSLPPAHGNLEKFSS